MLMAEATLYFFLSGYILCVNILKLQDVVVQNVIFVFSKFSHLFKDQNCYMYVPVICMYTCNTSICGHIHVFKYKNEGIHDVYYTFIMWLLLSGRYMKCILV